MVTPNSPSDTVGNARMPILVNLESSIFFLCKGDLSHIFTAPCGLFPQDRFSPASGFLYDFRTHHIQFKPFQLWLKNLYLRIYSPFRYADSTKLLSNVTGAMLASTRALFTSSKTIASVFVIAKLGRGKSRRAMISNFFITYNPIVYLLKKQLFAKRVNNGMIKQTLNLKYERASYGVRVFV